MSTAALTPPPPPPPPPQLSIPTVDLRLLSQSDLYTLSLSSSSPSPSSSSPLPPQINKSVFNESAGSRKQTYSRLRLAPRNPSRLSFPPLVNKPDPHSSENLRIVSLLKSLISGDPAPSPAPAQLSLPDVINEDKRKRGRPKQNPSYEPDHNPKGRKRRTETGLGFEGEMENVMKGVFVNKKKTSDFVSNKSEGDLDLGFEGERSVGRENVINGVFVNKGKSVGVGKSSDLGLEGEISADRENMIKGIFVNKRKGSGAGKTSELGLESEMSAERENVVKGIFVNKRKAGGSRGTGKMSDFVTKINEEDWDMEKERERANRKGIEVDLEEVARAEEPYNGELEKRTVGLKTEEEFLAFLGGLSGQWGSRRKKKRVVEADGFGDLLPSGWKLLLSCKKKEGRVWLYVRHYVSPNGRHFMSCKEVASYLLSLFGSENANQAVVDQRNTNAQPTQGITNASAADFAVNDNKESVKMECFSPSLVNSVPDQKQITPVIGNYEDIQADNVLACEKCNLSFSGKDEFMHHQLSSHRRRRSKFGSSITDGVIIIDGQFECQFCHKRFVERHRYNGHVGAHKRHHLKNGEGSPHMVTSLPCSVDLGSPYQVHLNETTMQASTGDDSDSANAYYRTDVQLKPGSSDGAFNVGSDTEAADQLHDDVYNLPQDEQESQSITNAQGLVEQHCFESDVDLKVDNTLGNSDEARFSTSLESAVPMSIDEIDANGALVASDFDDYRSSPIDQDNISGDDIIMNEASVTAADPTQQSDLEIISLASQGNDYPFNADIDDFPTNLPLETPKLERSKMMVKRSHCPSPAPIGNNEGHINTDCVDMVSPCALQESKQKRFSESDEEAMFGYKDIYAGCNTVSNPEIDEAHNSREVMVGHGKLSSSQRGELGERADHRTVDIVCTTESSGLERSLGIGNASFDMGNIAMREIERPNINERQTHRSNEIAFGISHHQIVRPEVRRPEYGVPFLSGHQQIFAEEKTTGVNSLLSQQKSNLDNRFRNEYCLPNPFSDVYTMSRVTNNSTEVPKPESALNSGNSELMIDFGNNGSGIVANPMDNVPMEQIFFEIDRSRESRRTGESSKQESNLLGSSYYNKPGGSENYLGRIDTGSVWDGPILDGAADFGNDKLMSGFSNNGSQSHVDPLGANMWRTDDRNTFQSSLAGSSNQHVGSSSFLNANMIPDKDDDLFLGYNGVQSAAPEQIEFSFMTPHSIDSYPRHSKTMYNSAMGQGFDSNFWLEKDDLSLNIAARNLVTSICVWCRNEFRHEPDNSGAQNGAIGSICPTCSARVSQQFNGY